MEEIACQMKKFDRCCCTCVWHRELHSHPWVDGKPISNKLGMICYAPDFEYAVMSTEHGLCEMHQTWDEKCAFYREGRVTMKDSKGEFKVGLLEEHPK